MYWFVHTYWIFATGRAQTRAQTAAINPIEISEDSHDENSDAGNSDMDSNLDSDLNNSVNSDSSVSGEEDAYYGGYGACYVCGMKLLYWWICSLISSDYNV